MNGCMGSQCLSVTHRYTDTQIHSRTSVRRWRSLVASMEILGCLEPWFYGTLGSSDTTHTPHAASGWRIHCGVEVTESSTNKQHTLSNPGFTVPLDLRNPGVTLLLDPRTFGCTEPWLYGTLESSEPWFYGTLGSSDSSDSAVRSPSRNYQMGTNIQTPAALLGHHVSTSMPWESNGSKR